MAAQRLIPVPSHLTEQGADIFYANDRVPVFGADDIAFLKARAAENPRLRSRLCLHPGPDAAIHEMLIVHHRDAYVRPHRNHTKTKSQYALEGTASVLVFDDSGTVLQTIQIGAPETGRLRYYRMPENVWNCLLIESEWFAFYEVIGGPFSPDQAEFAAWSPPGFDSTFMAKLRSQVSGH